MEQWNICLSFSATVINIDIEYDSIISLPMYVCHIYWSLFCHVYCDHQLQYEWNYIGLQSHNGLHVESIFRFCGNCLLILCIYAIFRLRLSKHVPKWLMHCIENRRWLSIDKHTNGFRSSLIDNRVESELVRENNFGYLSEHIMFAWMWRVIARRRQPSRSLYLISFPRTTFS